MYNEHRSWALFFFRIVEIVFTVNIILLDTFVFHNFISSTTSPIATSRITAPTPTPTIFVTNPTQSATTSPITTTIINQTTGAKEIFIPIGQGSVTATDWTNVSGAQVYIDSTKYSKIKQIVFEATLESPNNQIVWVQLYDQTDGHPVWNSQMSMNAPTQFLTSQPIQLDGGNKLYQVQMKSQLQYPVTLDLARIHITLQ